MTTTAIDFKIGDTVISAKNENCRYKVKSIGRKFAVLTLTDPPNTEYSRIPLAILRNATPEPKQPHEH